VVVKLSKQNYEIDNTHVVVLKKNYLRDAYILVGTYSPFTKQTDSYDNRHDEILPALRLDAAECHLY